MSSGDRPVIQPGRPILRGALAGAAGTAAMTVAARAEARWLDRPRRRRAAATVTRLGGITLSARATGVLDHTVHWSYGTGLGALRGGLAARGVSPPVATIGHFMVAWGAWRLARRRAAVGDLHARRGFDAALDAGNHLLYVLVTAGVAHPRHPRPARARP